ncbi:MAG: hypothetical protein AAGF88_07055 [Pseudomonadota bacterium]
MKILSAVLLAGFLPFLAGCPMGTNEFEVAPVEEDNCSGAYC